MKIHVKLYATLQHYAPEGTELGQSFQVELVGKTILDLVHHLRFQEGQARIVMVNGIRVTELEYQLKDGDVVVIFPPIGGG
ncbi:MAG: MoaD/ThiS family protein [Candidatus Thorarchaeota archaeon]|nr:MoaD/ThiS family protein [Candidatus Thorarchaeota archaeon]